MLASLHRTCFVLCNKSRNLSSFASNRFFIASSSSSDSASNLIVRRNLLSSALSFRPIFKGIKLRPSSPISIRCMSGSASSSPDVEQLLVENEVQEVNLLSAINDDHGGVIVEMKEKEPMDSGTFASMLRASVSHWRQLGKKGVWIKLPIQLANLVEAAVKEGFGYHHAEPDYLMLIYWIPESVNTLPANASHRVGIGAFVMNEKGEVLVVQENGGKFRGTGVWKFPTGVVDEGEDICAAAVREVKEETGIDAEFVEVLAFRQSHQSFFEKSDLFFVCMLRPLSFNIQKQELEIAEAEWMPFEEYAAQPFVQKHDLFRCIIKVCLAKRDRMYSGFTPEPTTSSFSENKSYLYLNTRDLNIREH